MNEEEPSFSSPVEEAAYWRCKAGEWRQAARDARDELDEFQEGSRELEAELEAQLEQAEIKSKDMKSLSNRLMMENEQLKDRLEQCSREYNYQISELQTELAEIKGIKDKLSRYVRELEQQNDDLERAKRSTLASLEDFEGRMNAAIERNAFLESELDEKEQLKMAVQRLKDETKDLRSELKVLNPQIQEEEPDNDRSLEKSMVEMVDSNKMAESCEGKDQDQQQQQPSTPHKLHNGYTPSTINGAPTPPLTPSARECGNGAKKKIKYKERETGRRDGQHRRISALGIVGDLLRKVGALELKLVSCRNIVKENSREGDKNGIYIGTKGKLPRGASSPAVKNMCQQPAS